MPAFSIAGTGSYLPPRIVTNTEVGSLIALTPSRIRSLFDIEERRWARRYDRAQSMPEATLADLAANAARAALDDAGVEPSDVDTLVAVSMTSEYVSPPLDYLVRTKLAIGDVLGFTLHAACTGLFRAATLVDALLSSEKSHVALIVAADSISRYFVFDPSLPKDLRMSMALYGDGAGAWVTVRPDDALPTVLGTTTVTTKSTDCPGIVFSGPLGGHEPRYDRGLPQIAYHDFRRVLSRGGELTKKAVDAALAITGASYDAVDHLITHQATGNMRGIATSLGLPADKVRTNIERVGNTLSPSTMILLDELARGDRLSAGDLLVIASAESATWSYGGMAVRWR